MKIIIILFFFYYCRYTQIWIMKNYSASHQNNKRLKHAFICIVFNLCITKFYVN